MSVVTRAHFSRPRSYFSTCRFLTKSQPLKKRFIVGFIKSQQGKSSVHSSAVEFLLSGLIISFACQCQRYVLFPTFSHTGSNSSSSNESYSGGRGKSSSVQSSQKEITLNLGFKKQAWRIKDTDKK